MKSYTLYVMFLVLSGDPHSRVVTHAEMMQVEGFDSEDRCELMGDGLRRESEGLSTKRTIVRVAWGCGRKK